jgi:crossover junction endodeoxyribonuclease RuvC
MYILIQKKGKMMSRNAIVLGVDPGSVITGYGIIQREGRASLLLDCGYLQMSSSKHIAERVHTFYTFFEQKIVQHHITDLALETPFCGVNPQSFLKLGYLRGVLYLLAQQHNMQLHEFSPSEVKQTVTGYGKASKEQVERMIMQLFPKLPIQKKKDVTDALAVMLCGLWQQQRPVLPMR